MSTYSSNLKIELIATGDQSGVWGVTTNDNFSNVFEQSIVGRVTVSFSNADVTLTATNTVASQDYRNVYLNCTGTNAASRNLIVPTLNKNYIVENNTTGGFSIVVKTSAGTGITIPNGSKCAVYVDGTNVVQNDNYFPAAVFASITDSGLTSGRVTYAGASGLLTDSANLLYSGTDLTVYGLTVGRGAGAISTNTAVGASALANNSSGSNSTAFGYLALNAESTNFENNAFGANAGKLTTSSRNNFFGSYAGQSNTSGADICAIGHNALGANTTGGQNTALGGGGPLSSNTTGSYNTGLGHAALYSNITASNSTAVGYQSAYSNTTGANNDAFGYKALYSNLTGAQNVAIGQSALELNTASNNTAVGHGAAAVNTSGVGITALGRAALSGNTTGSYNIAVGQGAFQSNTTASNNTAVGFEAGYSNTTGARNTVVGLQTSYYNQTGSDNTALGYGAMGANAPGTTTTGCTAIGSTALNTNNANNNTAVGFQAGYTNTTGNSSQFFGYQAGYSHTTGAQNVAIGDRVMHTGATTGNNNVAVGAFALDVLSSGNFNVAVGSEALKANTTAVANTTVGYQALQANITASYNTALGYQAGYTATATGNSYNVFLGAFTGYALTTGTKNTLLGSNAGAQITTGSNNTIIGQYQGAAAPISATGSNYVVLSDGDGNVRAYWDSSANAVFGGSISASPLLVASTRLTGKVNIDANINSENGIDIQSLQSPANGSFIIFRNNAGAVAGSITHTSSTAVLYNTTSDYRLKTVTGAVTGQGERIDALKPIDYQWKEGNQQARGFLAHEFQAVYSNSVSGTKDAVDKDGKPVYQAMQASTTEVIADLVAEIQSLRKRLTALESK